MKNTLFFALLISIALISCNQVKLETVEAEGLIKKTLELPKSYRYDVGWGQNVPMFGAGGKLDALQTDGLITWSNEPNGWADNILHVNLTQKSKPYFMGQNGNVYSFKIHDVAFDQITGISIDKNTQIATVRFTIKATNVTPIARSLKRAGYISYSIDNPLPHELIYKKFDSGWQLQSSQNKSSNEIVNEILK
jgi:hypothetical protein